MTNSTTISTSSTSTLPACGAASASGTAGANSTCADPYGNTFNVTSGRVYVGTVSVRAVRPNLNSCLTTCDTTAGCQAANYNSTSGECDLLSKVTSVKVVTGAAAAGLEAAQRPPNAMTIYTAPPMTTATTTTPSNSSTFTGVNSGGPGPVNSASLSGISSASYSSTGTAASPGGSMSTSMTGAMSSPYPSSMSSGTMGSTGTSATGASIPGYMSSSTGTSMMSGMGSSSMQMSGSSGSGGMTVTVSPIPASSSMSGGSGTSSSQTTTPSPVSSGPPCPAYNNTTYTDSQSTSYTVYCNSTYSGTVLSRTPASALRRAAFPYVSAAEDCLASCDSTAACMSISSTTQTCTLMSDVGSLTPDTSGMGAVAARKGATSYGGSGGMGGSGSGNGSGSGSGNGATGSVVTVTVCAAQRTTTVFTTATLTTCPAAGCTTLPGRAAGMIGMY
ncbi:hypothetical protein LTR12_015072 [Friedmanniomyces endolithicus]|uniref:Apple domain-containing protein n=1 Tax=Friedmanniomyces endolithicus TaxID=329885 RepID=A0A4U0V7T1_9PEZI|nr:hypothetical protein LTS09_009732 [Friedmanniomyces endolithicus]KAK1810565.1 hypothetical protein LTR12_015072 [Friedmanniomyces endolithicus]TKA44881.1 hypothetical protein B0A54_03171 [Friedmanniomyces endolithicus]